MGMKFLGFLMAIAVLPLNAWAADVSAGDRRTKQLFDLLDDNHDGVITLPEFKNNQMLVFYIWDRNKDLVLTPDEVPLPPDVFARIAGSNSKIDTIEFLNTVDEAFKRADANHDGKLDRREFATLRQRIRQ
ncbi:hypothetical protein [Azospirillum sp. sgz302134]